MTAAASAGGLVLVQLGAPVAGEAAEALRRAAERLGRLGRSVRAVRVHPPLESGLAHEAGTAAERARVLGDLLAAGETVVLAAGPMHGGRFAGPDSVVGGVLGCLGGGLRGRVMGGGVAGARVVGAMAHGHLLTALAWRFPGLRVWLGPPVAECIGSRTYEDVALEAGRALLGVVGGGPEPLRPLLRAPHEAHLGAQFDAPGTTEALGEVGAVFPAAIRTGEVRGPVAVSHVTTTGMLTAPAQIGCLDGAILLLEAGHLRAVDIDDYLHRLRWTGAFSRLAGMLVSVPVHQFHLPWELPLADIVERAVRGFEFPVACDAFVGSGYPCPVLEVGTEARLLVSREAVELA